MAVLKATKRSEKGSRKAKVLRAEGLIPAIIYGHGEETLSLTLNEHEVELAIHHAERLLEIDLDGKKEHALIKEIQWDTFGQKVLHVDLTRVDLDERVSVTIPIVLRGTPAGASEGGVLQQASADANIECPAGSIPEEIQVVVNDLNIGDSLYMRDLELPENVTLQSDADALVCSVSVIAEEVEEVPAEVEEEAAAAEPEVIGEKKEEEAEGGGEETSGVTREQ